MRPRLTRVLTPAALVVAGLAASAVTASAHDVRPAGQYTVALGWLHEPAYTGAENAVQVLVTDAAGKPVDGITDKDLTVDVSLNGQQLQPQPLVPTFDTDTGLGMKGEYQAPVIPTAPGNYTFHLHGAVRGTTVDETVTASDKTFAEVKDPADAQFPVKVPTASDLSTKLDRVSQRLDTLVASQGSGDTANRALVVAIVALVVGVVLGGGGVALAMLRGRRH